MEISEGRVVEYVRLIAVARQVLVAIHAWINKTLSKCLRYTHSNGGSHPNAHILLSEANSSLCR
jgi:hypothetical protein